MTVLPDLCQEGFGVGIPGNGMTWSVYQPATASANCGYSGDLKNR